VKKLFESFPFSYCQRTNVLQCVYWNRGHADNENQSDSRTETIDSNIFKSNQSNVRFKTMKSQHVRCDAEWKCWNLLFQFSHLIGFHCLGGPGFSKRTEMLSGMVWHILSYWAYDLNLNEQILLQVAPRIPELTTKNYAIFSTLDIVWKDQIAVQKNCKSIVMQDLTWA